MLISAGKHHGEEKPFPQGVRVQLIRLRSKATWFLVMATLCRMPVVPLFKQLGAASVGLIQKSWCFKTILPTLAGVSSVHALSGATTYVASDSGNSVKGTSGESFQFRIHDRRELQSLQLYGEWSSGKFVLQREVNGPMITGTLPSAGSYAISIIGHRYTGQNGNQTPPFNLSIEVAEANEQTDSSSGSQGSSTESPESVSPWNETNVQSFVRRLVEILMVR